MYVFYVAVHELRVLMSSGANRDLRSLKLWSSRERCPLSSRGKSKEYRTLLFHRQCRNEVMRTPGYCIRKGAVSPYIYRTLAYMEAFTRSRLRPVLLYWCSNIVDALDTHRRHWIGRCILSQRVVSHMLIVL